MKGGAQGARSAESSLTPKSTRILLRASREGYIPHVCARINSDQIILLPSLFYIVSLAVSKVCSTPNEISTPKYGTLAIHGANGFRVK